MFGLTGPSEINRTVDTSIYSRQSLTAAQSAFRQHCVVKIRPAGPGQVIVSVTPVESAGPSYREAVLEFWNYVIDTEAQRRLE